MYKRQENNTNKNRCYKARCEVARRLTGPTRDARVETIVNMKKGCGTDTPAAFHRSPRQPRETAVKGQFLRSAFLSTTMGPGIGLDVNAIGAMRVTI